MHKFEFSNENKSKIERILTHYPIKQSAMLAILDLAQRQNNGWISSHIIDYVSHFLSIVKVYEVVSFYSKFNLKPVGKYHIKICSSLPCMLKGSDKILDSCSTLLQIQLDHTSDDQLFTLSQTECLGACVYAPVVQIKDDYYENLSQKKIMEIVNVLYKQND